MPTAHLALLADLPSLLALFAASKVSRAFEACQLAELQGRGHGRAVIQAALAQAWADDRQHVLMQSGRKDPRVHAFYERLGFVPDLRTAYVARPPLPSHEE